MLKPSKIEIQILTSKLRCMERDLSQGESLHKGSISPVELDQTRVGRLSRADAIQQQALAQALRRVTIQLQRIRASLRRIETNQYGFCHECKTPIGVQRLLVDPCALFCQECALYKEREAAEEAKRSLHQGRPLKRR